MFSALRANKDFQADCYKNEMLGNLLGLAEKYYLICNKKKGCKINASEFSDYDRSNELQNEEIVRQKLIFQI